MNNLDWHTIDAAVWRPNRQKLKAVSRPDPIRLQQLIGIDEQKASLIANTERFLHGDSSNHALLWGSRGTGKSSLIKALLNAFAADGLRMLQIDKEELAWLPDILDDLEDRPFKFIIFCDDLSFEEQDVSYKPLKSMLEGGLELPPEHVRIYATSNRRHLMPERQSDNQLSKVVDGEVHYTDSLEDKLALSDRFGLWLSFYPPGWDTYFAMVDSLFSASNLDKQQLHEAARLFAMSRASHNGRTAKQFFQHYQTGL
ncbi:putative ATP/GTP-binding protein [Methylophaga frappieri]|uniref:Putative ATP/GTP-binding protein n=1 Tax=Methylophaga frappieri (strain ATCC BAA-2434 / DSM 25690 / JAM7) TaxID=754477 RepID=I1YFQ1_METFJ|nr:ATP-binding protein [Methylophaga frappieri]AFJ01744.1 putative ATP/GTP-binding protein [Methylophaga frappieri]